MSIKDILIIGIGSGIGGILRYIVSNLSYKYFAPFFPFGTLIVNVLGSFILGIVFFYLSEKSVISPELRLFLGIGFCGGFTTFSTFSLETFNLIRDTEYLLAFGNIILNLFLALIAVILAYWIIKLLTEGLP